MADPFHHNVRKQLTGQLMDAYWRIFRSETDLISLLILLFFLLFFLGRSFQRWNFAGLFLKYKSASIDESDFRFVVTLSRWRPWCHFTYVTKCCHLVNGHETSIGAYAAMSVSSWSIVHSYLFSLKYLTFYSENQGFCFWLQSQYTCMIIS